MSAAPDLKLLRATLEKRFGDAMVPVPGQAPSRERDGFRTGVAALDALVPGGVPRRAITLWTGEATSGRTAALRVLVEAACRETLVALVDATRTLDPASWCGPDGHSAPGLWVARPPSAEHAVEGAWVAETLLRTGAFGLVVLDGPAPAPVDAHRLRAIARETDAAVLISTDGSGGTSWRADAKLEFRRAGARPGLRPGGRFRRPSSIQMAKGWGARTGERQVELVHEPADRLRAPHGPDRRGAAWAG
ncbi:MAG TPA: hypothetical protein VHG08_28845 [Longimicrobium sp.]|nr:hypothetical protein [Longimicrobium sp.]